jgi:hypothetical protein
MSLFLFDDGGAEHSGLATVAENPGDRMLH